MSKTWLGFLSILPVIYIVFFMLNILSMFFYINSPTVPSHFPQMMLWLFPIHILIMFLNIGLMIYYLLDAVQSKKLTSEMRIIWVILIICFNMFIYPIYWYKFIRTQR